LAVFTGSGSVHPSCCRLPAILTPKRILQWKPIGTRTRGRPGKRWIAGIEEDLQIMGVRRWRKQCEERAEWKRITEKAKPTVGCNASKRRRRYSASFLGFVGPCIFTHSNE